MIDLRPRFALFTSIAHINLKEVDPGPDGRAACGGADEGLRSRAIAPTRGPDLFGCGLI